LPLPQYTSAPLRRLSRGHRRAARPCPLWTSTPGWKPTWEPLVHVRSRHNARRTGRILIARGRDAADVSNHRPAQADEIQGHNRGNTRARSLGGLSGLRTVCHYRPVAARSLYSGSKNAAVSDTTIHHEHCLRVANNHRRSTKTCKSSFVKHPRLAAD
jgi:hypothetical protein